MNVFVLANLKVSQSVAIPPGDFPRIDRVMRCLEASAAIKRPGAKNGCLSLKHMKWSCSIYPEEAEDYDLWSVTQHLGEVLHDRRRVRLCKCIDPAPPPALP